MAERREKVPHLLVQARFPASRYVSPSSFVSANPPERNRAIHAELLKRKLAEAERGILERAATRAPAARTPAPGSYVEFVGEPGYALALKSLDARRQGIEVVAVRKELVGIKGEQ